MRKPWSVITAVGCALWDARNTDATFAVVPDVHSGHNAIRITNGTPFGPHVYGHTVLIGGLSLVPGRTYTLSCYVKSDDPGMAWIGGGDGWRIRLRLPRTSGRWQRVSKTFTAQDKDAPFPLMVNTDGPTAGFLVDDVKLEQGDKATPFLDTEGESEVALVCDCPETLSCNGREAQITMAVHTNSARACVRRVARRATEGPNVMRLAPARRLGGDW